MITDELPFGHTVVPGLFFFRKGSDKPYHGPHEDAVRCLEDLLVVDEQERDFLDPRSYAVIRTVERLEDGDKVRWRCRRLSVQQLVGLALRDVMLRDSELRSQIEALRRDIKDLQEAVRRARLLAV